MSKTIRAVLRARGIKPIRPSVPKRADYYAASLDHAARRRIDWNRVHLAADRRKPFASVKALTKLDLWEGAR